MSWFHDFSTRAKLFMGFGLVIVLLTIVIVAAISNIASMEKTRDEIFNDEFTNSVGIFTLKSKMDGSRVALLTMSGVESRGEKDAQHAEIKESNAEIASVFKTLYDRNRHNPEITRLLEELERNFTEYKEARDRQLIPLIYSGKKEQAMAMAMGAQYERYGRMATIISKIENIMRENGIGHIKESSQASGRYITLYIVLGTAAVLVSLLVAVILNRLIARPLKEISDAAGRVASGDLTVDIRSLGRKDEVGVLSDTFGAMVARLKRQTVELTEAISVLASSSNEIAATTAELASGTEQTAVAVSETTTTVEEVKQTANVSSQKAKHVSEIALSAAQVSQNGTRLVKDTLEGITNIREQVEYIAETIVKLAEHNQAIGEIIAAVDDIAEQANLLAVNASIEASKAGEHGKGFMIVAQEIKSMSELSKQATKQVRSILNDIQKSSSAAVMATERGSKAVEATVRQSSGTGEAIQALASSIGEASQAVIQIAASNQQQLIGMDQVAVAMNNIKQATTQNAASTKQVEMTIRNLQEIGGKLKEMVRHYKV
ncbi:Methyl-accepting chemotaxis protein I [uncultured bacterium]|nr:Methyl-accepting chemotaxis protein I [uncultured bacterium]